MQTEADLTGEQELTGRLAEAFLGVSSQLRRNSARRLAPLGLTYAQARLLRTIAGAVRPPRMSEVAAGLGIVPRSATTAVEALEAAGFVVRLPDPNDRRSVLVALTPNAELAVTRIQSARCDAADEVFAALDVRERATLLALLDRHGHADVGDGPMIAAAAEWGWGAPSWRRDQSVLAQELTPGIVKRVLKLALGYKKMLALFLLLVTVDAVLGTLNPLILRDIINNGIGGHDSQLVIQLALLAAGIATLDMIVTLIQRYVSARIGESLIFDLRARVFGHVQRMPIAFFTRTQTGALVSRLNNDIIGAQQAFTNTLGSVVSNIITVTIVIVAMLALSWQITLASLALSSPFVVPGAACGQEAADDHPRALHGVRGDEQHHDGAVQCVRCPAREAVRHAGARAIRIRRQGCARPRPSGSPRASTTGSSTRRCSCSRRSRPRWCTAGVACSPSKACSTSARWWRSRPTSNASTGRSTNCQACRST